MITTTNQPSILMLMPYFGQWPVWVDLYLESCKWNPSIDWLFFTDCGEPANRCPNVRYVQTSKAELERRIETHLGVRVSLSDSYKLCDLKPTYGELFAEYLTGYDYWGYGDVDVIYGNIRHLYTPEVLIHDIISSNDRMLAGHFALFKNRRYIRHAFRGCHGWRELFTDPNYRWFDERIFTRHITRFWTRSPLQRMILRGLTGRFYSCYMVAQYATTLGLSGWLDNTHEYPSEWYWQNGRLTNNKNPNREFLYLHFMQWKSARYLIRELGEPSAWEQLDQIVHLDPASAANGFKISRYGFYAL